jgi:hypothetical protein
MKSRRFSHTQHIAPLTLRERRWYSEGLWINQMKEKRETIGFKEESDEA